MKRPRSATRRAQPRQGEILVDAAFKRLGLAERAREWRAMHAWRRAAGPRVAARVRAERVRGATMMLRVASAAWANELGYLRATLLERLRQTPGAEWIEELRFSIGPLEEAPDFGPDDARDGPFGAPAPDLPPLTLVDDGAIAATLKQIDDQELRAVLAELYARARHRDA